RRSVRSSSSAPYRRRSSHAGGGRAHDRLAGTPGRQHEGQTGLMSSPTTLYRGGRIRTPVLPTATALLVRDGVIAWVGTDAEAPRAQHVVDLDGALVTPAFVDSHVHTTDTGLTLTGLDLSHTRSADQVLDAVADAASRLPPHA